MAQKAGSLNETECCSYLWLLMMERKKGTRIWHKLKKNWTPRTLHGTEKLSYVIDDNVKRGTISLRSTNWKKSGQFREKAI